ncbi:hypothetical protein BP5796_12942 [Coleophoma crateriformis]|uniref:Uncharacterized protein n=1 Tax=Coleophoma crateriformis TaxID=565419 RepID=A0A3D8Q4V7_9HELO|nr:hypothetical protein BP5796_12942 [Coleophoma crateriformis]
MSHSQPAAGEGSREPPTPSQHQQATQARMLNMPWFASKIWGLRPRAAVMMTPSWSAIGKQANPGKPSHPEEAPCPSARPPAASA